MKAPVYNLEGKKVSELELPVALFGCPWNADLVHQVTVAMAANQRRTTNVARDRGAVAGGGRKPWRQKGTGRARHGSIRSPIWRGGGVAHGPTAERRYQQKINLKMRRRALATVLSRKWRDGEVLFVDDLSAVGGKTKVARQALDQLAKLEGFRQLGYKRGRRALVAAPKLVESLARGFRNLPIVSLTEARNLNPLDALKSRYLLVSAPEESLEVLQARLTS